MLHNNDRQAYCEASSGLYRNAPAGRIALSPQSQEIVKGQGFILDEDKDNRAENYHCEIDDVSSSQRLWYLTGFMLETLYRVYDARQDHVTVVYPALVRVR